MFSSAYTEFFKRISKRDTKEVFSLLPLLVHHGVINSSEENAVQSKSTDIDRILYLFEQIMPSKNIECQQIFINILHASSLEILAQFLVNKIKGTRMLENVAEIKSDFESAAITGSPATKNLSPLGDTTKDALPAVSAVFTHKQWRLNTTGRLELQVKPLRADPSESGKNFDAYYHNCSTPKGHALLINNSNFTGDFSKRTDSEVDLANMGDLLEALGYSVVKKQDLTAKNLRDVMKQFTLMEPDSYHWSSFIIYLSTYARDGLLFGIDGNGVSQTAFFQMVTECKALAGKPKIFIVQACHGDGKKFEVELTDETEKLEWDGQKNFLNHIPNAEDTCILHSVTPGHFTWHNSGDRGSWFVQAMCEVMAENAHEPKADLMTLITLVNQKLQDAFKAMPWLLLMNATTLNMKKLFHFFPKTACYRCTNNEKQVGSSDQKNEASASNIIATLDQLNLEKFPAFSSRHAVSANSSISKYFTEVMASIKTTFEKFYENCAELIAGDMTSKQKIVNKIQKLLKMHSLEMEQHKEKTIAQQSAYTAEEQEQIINFWQDVSDWLLRVIDWVRKLVDRIRQLDKDGFIVRQPLKEGFQLTFREFDFTRTMILT